MDTVTIKRKNKPERMIQLEAKAVAKGVRIAPRKARLVIDLIRGKDVVEADTILANINKEASRLIQNM